MIVGRVDGVRNGKVYGWAFNSDNPDEHLEIKVSRSGAVIAAGFADRFRADLPEAGIGKGDHAFDIALPPEISSFHGVIAIARSALDGEAPLPYATNDERRVDDLFQVFSRRYDEILVAFKTEIDDLKKINGDGGQPKTEVPADVMQRLSQVETRLDEIEVFVVRLDEIARDLEVRMERVASRGFFSPFVRKRK